MTDVNLDDVRALAQVMQDFDLTELELCRPSGEKLRLQRQNRSAPISYAPPIAAPPSAPASAGGAASPSPQTSGGTQPLPQNVSAVTAPLVGTFYRAASPDNPSFVEVGQRVRKGQTLCIIEAMKLMNELESEVDGVVVACLAENGRPVEFGETLFHIQIG